MLTPRFELGLTALLSQPSYFYEEPLPPLPVDIISEEEEGSEEYFISLRCEEYLEGVFNIRQCKFDIILSSYFGYEVPVYAIRVRDGKNGVLVEGSGVEIFKECEILKRDDKSGIVMIAPTGDGSELKNGDRIIITKEK